MYDTTTVISYVRKALPDFFGSDAELKAGELSDGNINYVFRVEDVKSGRSLIVKHAEDVADFCDKFDAGAKSLMAEKSCDRMMSSACFRDAYMADIFRDQAGFAGTELIRRIVGTSKVKDITSIGDEHARAKAEMLCLKAGIAFVTEPEKMTCGSAYVDLLKALR